MATLRPWVNRRKTLRGQALKQYPGRTVQWINSQLHFTRLVDGKHVSAGLVPGIDTVPKGPHVPTAHKQARQAARRADQHNKHRHSGAKFAAQ